jgi:hypothetical protein
MGNANVDGALKTNNELVGENKVGGRRGIITAVIIAVSQAFFFVVVLLLAIFSFPSLSDHHHHHHCCFVCIIESMGPLIPGSWKLDGQTGRNSGI